MNLRANDDPNNGFPDTCTPAAPQSAGAPMQGHTEFIRREVLDGLFVLVAILTPDGALLEINERALAVFGLPRAEIRGMSFLQIARRVLDPRSISEAAVLLKRAGRGGSAHGELRARFAGGRSAVLDFTFNPLRDRSGTVVQIAVTGVDVTSHKMTELSLQKLNRQLRLLAECNLMLIRMPDEQGLLDGICRILIDVGGYRLAWVGFALNDPQQTVRPTAFAGIGADYVKRGRISWGNSQFGQGPTGRAIRDRTATICGDVASDPLFSPWRSEAVLRGHGACIALPLLTDAGCIGVLNIYSAYTDTFEAAEVKLLVELAGNLAHGIETLRTRGEHKRVEDQMILFRELLQHAQDIIYVADARTGRILDVNESAARNLEYTSEEILRLTIPDFSVIAAQQPWAQCYEYLKASRKVIMEGLYKTKTGRTFPVETSLRFIEHADGEYVTGVSRNMAERQHQIEHIDRLTRILRMQSGINAAVLRMQNRNELLQEACRLATEVGGYDRAVLSVVDASGKFAIPCFRAGRGTDFPEPLQLAISGEQDFDSNLSGRALRTGTIAVNSDLSQNGPAVSMREKLVKLGYKAAAALPLIVDGRPVAALMLTTRDADLVADSELLVLLQDMMASLSFAMRSKEHFETAQYLTYYDPLTGLAKRSLFLENLSGILGGESGRYHEYSVIVFDVRGLNRINDTRGRHFGDLALLRVAERLKHYATSDAHVAHLGGGSFALVERRLPTGDDGAKVVLDSSLFGESFDIKGQSLRLSCSYGVAHFPGDGEDAGGLLDRAEAALKQAKESGEQYLHYRLEMRSRMAEQLELENKLKGAVAANQFELYYQPQVELRSGRVEAVEGLLRWNDPVAGLVSPQRFLPTLESTGMILAVGEWALNQAAEDCIRWHDLGLRPFRIAVNVSAVQLRQRSFVLQVLRCSERIKACPGYGLDIEITESLLQQDLEGTERKLRELRAAGVRVALDDFGTGYSALGLLSKLPLDLLKIDKSFVIGLPDDAASVLLVETILRLASSMNLTTVVEGVETEAQLRTVRAMRCDMWQGYLHSRPMTANALTELLHKQ